MDCPCLLPMNNSCEKSEKLKQFINLDRIFILNSYSNTFLDYLNYLRHINGEFGRAFVGNNWWIFNYWEHFFRVSNETMLAG